MSEELIININMGFYLTEEQYKGLIKALKALKIKYEVYKTGYVVKKEKNDRVCN